MIRALRNRCSIPTPIEQRRGAVRRLGFAPIPGRRFNSPLTDLAWDSSPGHRVGTPWLTTTVLACAPKDRTLGCVPTLPAATSSAASEFNPGSGRGERAARAPLSTSIDEPTASAGGGVKHLNRQVAVILSRARNSSCAALFMSGLSHVGIGDANKNIGGVK